MLLNDIYILKSNGKYDEIMRKGDDFINNAEIHSSPYAKIIILHTMNAAYKTDSSTEKLIQYLDLYIKLYNEVDASLSFIYKEIFFEPLSNLDSKILKSLIIQPNKSTKKLIEILIYHNI